MTTQDTEASNKHGNFLILRMEPFDSLKKHPHGNTTTVDEMI